MSNGGSGFQRLLDYQCPRCARPFDRPAPHGTPKLIRCKGCGHAFHPLPE